MTYHTFVQSAANTKCYVCSQPKHTHKTFIGKDREVRIPNADDVEIEPNNIREYFE